MTPTLHVRIHTQAASWLRSQARANRRSVGAETQFVVEQAMVRAELVGWDAPRNVKLNAAEKLYVRGMGKLCEEDRA